MFIEVFFVILKYSISFRYSIYGLKIHFSPKRKPLVGASSLKKEVKQEDAGYASRVCKKRKKKKVEPRARETSDVIGKGGDDHLKNCFYTDSSTLCQETNDLCVSNEGSVSWRDWEESVALQFAKGQEPPNSEVVKPCTKV